MKSGWRTTKKGDNATLGPPKGTKLPKGGEGFLCGVLKKIISKGGWKKRR